VRRLLPGAAAVAIGAGIVLNSAIGLTGYHDLLKQLEPAQYHAFESFWQPVGQFLSAVGVRPGTQQDTWR
jgi:hypothetical protein